MRLYHGTTATHLPAILRRGLEPRGSRPGNYIDGTASRADAVYLTNTFPLTYAMRTLIFEREHATKDDCSAGWERAWRAQADERRRRALARDLERKRRECERKPGKLVVVEVDADRLNPFDLIPDEDALEQSFNWDARWGQLSAPEREWARDRTPLEVLATCRERTSSLGGYYEASLYTLGTCAHIGPVPLVAITRVAVIDPRKAPTLCEAARITQVHLLTVVLDGVRLRSMVARIFGDEPADGRFPESEREQGIRVEIQSPR